MIRRKHNSRGGFTILEVAIAILLILLVGTTAASSLRMGLRTLSGPEMAAVASSAVREFREFALPMTIDEIDALGGTTITNPTVATGDPLPDAENLSLNITVTPVDDIDPAIVVAAADSRSRIVDVVVTTAGRTLLTARWLKTGRD